MNLNERLRRVPEALDAEGSNRLKAALSERLQQLGPAHASLAPEQVEVAVYRAIGEAIGQHAGALTRAERAALVRESADGILGSGPLEALLRDDSVTEIMVARFDRVFLERAGKVEASEAVFESEEALRRSIDRIVSQAGRRIDEASPMVDARLADGSRINAVVPPIAVDGANLTIRKFTREALTAADLTAVGTFTEAQLERLRQAIAERRNIVVSGGTGSGKTTTLNALAGLIGGEERIVTIEDAAEMRLTNAHVVRLEARPANIEGQGEVTIRALVRNALRMRPDRILVGEVRDGAALDMLQAMSTGHDGSLTTVHASSPADALDRLVTMCLLAGTELPAAAIRAQLVRAIDLIVQQSRLPDGRRVVTDIVAVGEAGGLQ